MTRVVSFIVLVLGCMMNMQAANATYNKETESLAKKGDIVAMVEMGDYYAALAPATYDNAKKAASWYKKAMEKGSATGRFRYAEIMANGSTGSVKHKDAIKALAMTSNDSVATRFYNEGMKAPRQASGQALLYCAATMGYAPALYELALLYESNSMQIKREGEKYNLTKAIQLMEDAGRQNFVPALTWVISAYTSKRKEPENVNKWRGYLSMVKPGDVDVRDAVFAQKYNDTYAIYNIYELLTRNKSYAETIDLARNTTSSLTPMNAKYALEGIFRNLPIFQDAEYYSVLKNIIKSNNIDLRRYDKLLLIGVENNDAEAFRQIAGYMLSTPSFLTEARDKIESFLRTSADAGNTSDAFLLAEMLCRIDPTTARRSEAVKYYIESNSDLANEKIASLAYDNGTATAVDYIRKRANAGDADAQGWLGKMYAYGKGVGKDLKEAKKWLDKAELNGQAQYKRECYFVYPSESPKSTAKPKQKATEKKTSGIDFQQSKEKR